MIICRHCFCDSEIRARITSHSHRGKCPTCGEHDSFLYDTEKESYLNGIFDKIISIYSPSEELPEGFPVAKKAYIKDELLKNWNIFHISNAEIVYEIVKALSPDLYSVSPQLFDTPVANLHLLEPEYFQQNSILCDNTWDDFVESLKHENRFHTNYINTEVLKVFCSYIRKAYKAGQVFYRGRLSTESGYPCEEMGAPPQDKVTDGRANSMGIRRLYLTNDPATTFHEIRARAFDYVTIGTFQLKRDIKVVDLKMIDKISPFIEELDALQYAINREHLNKIDSEMSRPMRRSDSVLDYVPTQYIVDFIQSITHDGNHEYDGIEYKSTVNPSGYNLAIFDPDIFECTSVKVYRVKGLRFDTEPLDE